MKGGVILFRGSGVAARRYVEADRSRADEYYLGADQAVAEYVDHYAPVRTKGDEAAARAARVLTSDDPDRIKRRAWTALAPA